MTAAKRATHRLRHLERGRVAVPHEVSDEATIFRRFPGTLPVRDTRGLHHGGVVAHVVHHAHEPVVEARNRFEQHGFQRRDGGAAGLRPMESQLGEVSLVFLRDAHGPRVTRTG